MGLVEGQTELNKDDWLILGANSPTGQKICEAFAGKGCRIIAGTTSEAGFNNVGGIISAVGGLDPRPFIADLTKRGQVLEAYNALGIRSGTQLNIINLASRGIEPISEMLKSKTRSINNGSLSLEEASQDVRLVMACRPDIYLFGLELNYCAAKEVTELFIEGGHLRKGSILMSLNSTLSDIYNPKKPRKFRPVFYGGVAEGKKKFALWAQKIAEELEITNIEGVASEIDGTMVGRFLTIMDRVFKKAMPGLKMNFPSITTDQVAASMLRAATERGSGSPNTKAYFDGDKIFYDECPESLKNTNIPYF